MNPDVRRALAAVFVARTAITGGLRVVYPFLPAIARGLGIPLSTLGNLIALRNLGGVAAPLAARIAENMGRRSLMTASTVIAGTGCLLTALAPSLALAGVGLVMVGVSKPAFDVPMQSWLGDRVPYEERGRVFGISEFSWSLALLVTVPVSGFLITATDWRAPFFLVAGFCVAGVVAILIGIDSDRPARRIKRSLEITQAHIAMLSCAFLFSVAAEILFLVYGRWLEDAFGLSIGAIGVFTLVVVASETAGEGIVTTIADRVGLKRMIMGGLVGSAVAYASLGFVGGSLAGAVVAVIAWFITFEITIVAAIPFTSELAVAGRDRLLSLMSVVVVGGRAAGAAGAGPLYDLGAMRASGIAASILVLMAAVVLTRVPDPGERPEPADPGMH
ncbi:MAG TPA: MFS transporter [Actinomycetota bacterium]|nr:MFS transporter [Actinomycetota bacterium]